MTPYIMHDHSSLIHFTRVRRDRFNKTSHISWWIRGMPAAKRKSHGNDRSFKPTNEYIWLIFISNNRGPPCHDKLALSRSRHSSQLPQWSTNNTYFGFDFDDFFIQSRMQYFLGHCVALPNQMQMLFWLLTMHENNSRNTAHPRLRSPNTHTHTTCFWVREYKRPNQLTERTGTERSKKKKILIIWCRRQNLLFPPFRNHLSIHSLVFYYFAVLVHWHNTIIRRHKTDNYHTNTSTRTMSMCCTTQHRWI